MPTDIFLILTVILTSQGITLMIVQSSFRKKETIVLFGLYFILNALLSAILIYATPYKITILECLRGYALFFTFFFFFMAWNSIVVPAKRWLQFSKKVMIGGIVVGTFHAIVIVFYTFQEQGLVMDSYSNVMGNGFWGIRISVALMVATTTYLVFICMKRMIRVNMLFLDYIMDNYSYIEESLIKYKNGVIMGVLCAIISFLIALLMIFCFSIPIVIIYVVYQLIYLYRVLYIVFNFATYEKYESTVTVYFANFLAETNTAEFNLFFPSESEVLLDDKYEELRNRLLTYFGESKPYISKKLIMQDVARELNTNRTYISKIINTDFDTTFFNFVNVFRIEEAKRQIEATSSYSLKAIADNCGFSSYTTFVKYHKIYLSKPAEWYEKLETISK